MAETEWLPPGWRRDTFRHGEHRHAFYEIESNRPDAPTVLLMHEFPGISDNLVALADDLARAFRIVVPSILGRDGSATVPNSLKQLCVRREIHVFARGGVSSTVGWLQEFVEKHVAPVGGGPYGVVGMCFTGNFALALAVDKRVRAAVVGQPAIPIWPSALGLSDYDREALQNRTDLCVRGYRFRKDWKSPKAKLRAAQDLLGNERMRTFTLDTPDPHGHSTLTGASANQDAIAEVKAFLRDRLDDSPTT
jgi:dienelactone hydrolase